MSCESTITVRSTPWSTTRPTVPGHVCPAEETAAEIIPVEGPVQLHFIEPGGNKQPAGSTHKTITCSAHRPIEPGPDDLCRGREDGFPGRKRNGSRRRSGAWRAGHRRVHRKRAPGGPRRSDRPSSTPMMPHHRLGLPPLGRGEGGWDQGRGREQAHGWFWIDGRSRSGASRFGPTKPRPVEPKLLRSVDQTDARTATVRASGPKTVELPFMMLLTNSRQRPFGGVWTRSFALRWGNPDSWDRGLNSRAVTFMLTNLLHC